MQCLLDCSLGIFLPHFSFGSPRALPVFQYLKKTIIQFNGLLDFCDGGFRSKAF